MVPWVAGEPGEHWRANFGILVADDEISAETFSTLGSLSGFIDTELRL